MKKILLILTLFWAISARAAITQVSPLSFGADPTGVRDSTAAIQRFLDAADLTTLECPAGVFKINSTGLTVGRSGKHIKGVSGGQNGYQTIFKAASANMTVFKVTADASLFSDITIQGEAVHVGGDGTVIGVLADIADCDATFLNCTFVDLKEAGRMRGRNVTFDGCSFLSVGYGPIFDKSTVGGTDMRGYIVQNSRFHGLRYCGITFSPGAALSHAFVTGNTFDGLNITTIATGEINALKFSNNTIYRCVGNGLALTNNLAGLDSPSIGDSGITIENNTFFFKSYQDWPDCLYLSGPNFKVINNTITGCPHFPLRLTGGGNNSYIHGNVIDGAGIMGMVIENSTNVVVSKNRISNWGKYQAVDTHYSGIYAIQNTPNISVVDNSLIASPTNSLCDGISLQAINPRVTGNTVISPNIGIYVGASCTNALISLNTIIGATDVGISDQSDTATRNHGPNHFVDCELDYFGEGPTRIEQLKTSKFDVGAGGFVTGPLAINASAIPSGAAAVVQSTNTGSGLELTMRVNKNNANKGSLSFHNGSAEQAIIAEPGVGSDAQDLVFKLWDGAQMREVLRGKPTGQLEVTDLIASGTISANSLDIGTVITDVLYANSIVNKSNLKWWGAKGDGTTDDTAAIQAAITAVSASTNRFPLYAPSGYYRLTSTITARDHMQIYGDAVDPTYKGAIPMGTVFYTSGNFTAFQTPRLSSPSNNLPYWAAYISLRDLTIMGTNLQASAESNTYGFDGTGIRVSDFNRLNIQGFGRGLLLRNCSEVTVANSLFENNFIGIWAARDPAGAAAYDCHVTFRDVLSVNNQVNAIFDNPRALYWSGGELNSNWTNRNVSVTNCNSDTQIVLREALIENHSSVYAAIETDTNGVGSLVLRDNNLETDANLEWVAMRGFHDNLEVVGSSAERSLTRTNPIVRLYALDGATNYFLRTHRVYVQSATHQWFDAMVRNDQVARPEIDYVPAGYINLNPRAHTDRAGDGIISVAGDFTFLNTNTLCGGLSRVMWQNVASNNVYSFLTPTNLTRGYDHLYVIATVYDNDGASVPHPDPQGWGAQGVGWSRTGSIKIGEYTTADGVKFSKWAWSIVAYNPALITNGFTSVNLYDIYGTTNGATKNLYGLERFCVYANSVQNPYGLRTPKLSAAPTGLNGWHVAGEFIQNGDFTANPAVYGYLCTAYGFPGTFRRVDALSLPDLLGTLTPGINTWGTYYRGYGANTNWPVSTAVLYDASSVDQYSIFNGLPYGGTKASPTFFGSNSGGNFLRSRTAGGSNDGVFEVGFFNSGAGTSGTTLLSITPAGVVSASDRVSATGHGFVNRTSAPTAASLGANGAMFWVSNTIPYLTVSIDGVSATTKAVSLVP